MGVVLDQRPAKADIAVISGRAITLPIHVKQSDGVTAYDLTALTMAMEMYDAAGAVLTPASPWTVTVTTPTNGQIACALPADVTDDAPLGVGDFAWWLTADGLPWVGGSLRVYRLGVAGDSVNEVTGEPILVHAVTQLDVVMPTP